ncbi:MAG: chromosome segregation protein SMC [Cyanobacteria bacterium RU_5_0]|nr:chromosome segregation protein SMC [Cyanobacteria bacterium RU_5_0]
MYIKRIELSHFKSFGGTTQIPLLPEFTVISGPNGSGKSNILDALLFALGLSSSKGMRAERLPDLVNQNQTSRGRSTIEASVTVTFAIEGNGVEDRETRRRGDAETDEQDTNFENNGSTRNGQLDSLSDTHHSNGHSPHPLIPSSSHSLTEWTVTRKLRVTQQGTYTSNYSINEQACTLTELHEQLNKFRIYPEGYNVVLQGDVTSIISMNPRERREIIDELAGVAAFDRKIIQAKEKLDAVKEREERFRIVERELIAQCDRLAQDRIKAEKYQRLKAELQTKTQWETVLLWRTQAQQAQQLQAQIEQDDRTHANLTAQLTTLAGEIQQATAQLDQLNARVKALGEDEFLALQASLATREAELRQLHRQEQDLIATSQETATSIDRRQREIQEQLQAGERLAQEKHTLETRDLTMLRQNRDQAQQELDRQREAASTIAEASEAWVQEQTALRHQMEALLHTLEPQRTEQARLHERVEQLQLKIQEQNQALEAIVQDAADKQQHYQRAIGTLSESHQQVESLQYTVTSAERELQVQQDTQTRLIQEQREKQRQLDKLEAQAQAIRDTQGTGIIQILEESGLAGICGLVAQLGRVDPQYQLALEIAAGARLSYLVVEDDGVAAAGIQLLKRLRAGRATFLPLNKIRSPQFNPIPVWNRPEGFIDYASHLIDCDERYREVFAYIFTSTVVFTSLNEARRYMGQYRIVTLDGELLETSGAMTGGSITQRQGALHFGTVESAESAEAIALRERLHEIDRVLSRCQMAIAEAVMLVKQQSQALLEARQQYREGQLQSEQLQKQLATLVTQEGQLRSQLSQNTQELTIAQDRLSTLERELPQQEAELQRQRQILADLEQSQTHREWQQIQATIRTQEAQLNDRQRALQAAEHRLQHLDTQQHSAQEKINQFRQRLQDYRTQQANQLNQRSALSTQSSSLTEQIAQTQAAMANLEQTLAAEKQERDRAERQLREQQTAQQQLEWQRQKLLEMQQARREELATLREQLETKRAELPEPLPEIPEAQDLVALQYELRSLQKKLQAMEPVNMLALEEYDRTQARLEDLSQKLATLDEERTELLLRIENFTTLRQRAFKEAFDAVNQNFQVIFAELSDGDGYLQLDDPHDPFASGLNLVAHPKGKPVRRLASMSGGEKSLTALSFIFALQRYRPSPFYAFDEVDMFLDGANVERLARMIKHQAQQAQFIVVSLRRPMIESAERTIGVTQARGAYTQVLGIDLQAQTASV